MKTENERYDENYREQILAYPRFIWEILKDPYADRKKILEGHLKGGDENGKTRRI